MAELVLENREQLLQLLELGELDHVVALALEICAVPTCMICVLDSENTTVVKAIGAVQLSVNRKDSFCAHTIEQSGLFVVEDAKADKRFVSNQFVLSDPGVRFYAGFPICSGGEALAATLCVIDTKPRVLTSRQRAAMAILGRHIQVLLSLQSQQRSLEAALKAKATAEQELRRANTLFEAFMNNGPFLSYIKDADGRFVYHNTKLALHFDLSPNECVGRTDHDLWPKELADHYRSNDLRVLGSGELSVIDETSLGKDAALTRWKSYKFPMKDESGNVFLAGMSVDVTALLEKQQELSAALNKQQQLTKALEESEFVLNAFMHHSPYEAFLKSMDGKYIFYNSQFAYNHGISQSEWLNLTDYDVMSRKDANRVREQELLILEDGRSQNSLKVRTLKDGQSNFLRAYRFTYRHADGRPVIAGLNVLQSLGEARRLLSLESQAGTQFAAALP